MPTPLSPTPSPSPQRSRRSGSRREFLRTAAVIAAGGGLIAAGGALAGCSSVPAAPGPMRLATGPSGAAYREVGAALTELWNDAWDSPVVEAITTEAAVDNLDLLLSGGVDLGLLNVDVAADHVDRVCALLRVFDSVLQVVVPLDSPARSVRDLAGKRVCVGLPGSGSRFISDRVFDIAGIDVERIGLGQTAAVAEMIAGRLDGWMSMSAMPTPAISELVDRAPDRFRFVELGVQDEMLGRYPRVYLDTTISPAIYPGADPVRAIGSPTVLTVRPDFDEQIAWFLTATTMRHTDHLAGRRTELFQINPRTAVATTPIPLHPGAARYHREAKL